jgi:hypothetical protein
VCKERDLVTEMVFLLGRMGNNRQALTLIIERLGDVNRVCLYVSNLLLLVSINFVRRSILLKSKMMMIYGRISSNTLKRDHVRDYSKVARRFIRLFV